MMNENNLKVKVSAKEQGNMQNNQATFNQHKFISDIYECEKKRYILNKRIDKLNKELLGPQRPNFKCSYEYDNYCKEVKKKKNFPNKVKKPEISSTDVADTLITTGAIPGAIIGVIVNIIIDIVKGGLFIWPVITITLIFIIGSILFNLSMYNKDLKNYTTYCNALEETKKYNSDVDKYNKERYKYWENERHKRYVTTIDDFEQNTKPIIEREKEQALHQISAVYDTLEMLYNVRVNGVLCLHPNYQGLVPISIIYGYFDTGRCTQLHGHEGAYNLYEDEKMKGMIINKLDIVSQQLNQLNNSMVYVGQAIEECNNRLSDLESTSNKIIQSVNNMNNNVTSQLNGVSSQMAAIEENTANSAYYAEVGAKMTTFNTVYNLLND